MLQEQDVLYIKHETPCLSTFPNTEKRVENMTQSEVFLTNFKVFENVVKHCVEWLIYHSILSKINIFPKVSHLPALLFHTVRTEDERPWGQGWFKMEQCLVITHAQAPSKSCSSFVLIF